MRERNAAMPATVSRMDRRQQPPRARRGTSRPTTAPLPSKPPLFGYKIRHDGQITARAVKAAAYSTARCTILPHVAEFALSLAYKRKANSPAAGDRQETTDNIRGTTHSLPNSPTTYSATSPGTWRPGLLSCLACSCPTTGTPVPSNIVPRAHHCWTYGPPAGTRINLVSLIA
jgi:hypothetical protein